MDIESFVSLKTLPEEIFFSNGGYVALNSLQTIQKGIKFSDKGDVYLEDLIGDWFSKWKGNIKGINPNILLNKMIGEGLFKKKYL